MKSLFTFLSSKGQLGALILGLVASAIAVGSIISGVSSKYTMSTDLVEVMKSDPTADFSFVMPAIMVVVALIVIASLLMVLFGLTGILSNPKGSMKAIIGLVGLIVLFFIFYTTSTSGMESGLADLLGKFDVSEGVSKYIGGGIKTAVWGIAIAFVAAAVMELMNLFK